MRSETLFQDLRFGLRILAKSPSVTAIAVIALALGIGATTAIFSVINAVLLHPLGNANTDRLVIVYATNPRGVAEYPGQADFFDWQQQARSFEKMLAWRGRQVVMTGLDQPLTVYSHRVSDGFFELLGLRPLLGRTFSAQDYEPGSARTAILTHRFWMTRFGGDPKVVGRSVAFDNEIFNIVGVMAAGDFQLFASRRPDLWVPLELTPHEKQRRRAEILGALARLRADVTLRQAQAEMDVIARRIASQHPDTNKDWGAKVNLAAEDLVADIRPTFFVLLGAVLLVLLIACANVANLMLARASSRQKELAIRLALGAKRSRVIRQLLTESLLLGLLGGALGILLAYASIAPLIRLIPETATFAGIGNIRVDRSVLVFSFLVSIVTSILFGLAPALQGSRADLGKNLGEGGRGSTVGAKGGRLRGLLVVSEVVLALVLLIGAGLMLRSFQKLQTVDPGFRQDHVLTMTILIPGNRYSPDKLPAFFDQLTRRIEALPGVISAGITTGLPLRYSEFTTAFTIDGAPIPAPGTEPRSGVQMTSPGYFGAMGIRLLDGRYITERDIVGAPRVALINSAMATRYWRGESPIGKRIRVPIMRLPPDQAAVEIVGVVADVRAKGLAVKPEPAAYFAHAQYPTTFGVFAVRTAGNPRSLAATLQKEVWALDRNQPVIDVLTMDEIVSDSVWQLRFAMALLGAFGLTAVLLAASGLYAVMAYSVRQRTHEIGLRMALGSSSGGVLRLMLASALKLALTGVAAGLVVSTLLYRALSTWLEGLGGATQTVNQWIPSGQRGLLYGLSPTDPLTFAAIAGMLVAVTLVASYVPARRASRLDPMTALRCE